MGECLKTIILYLSFILNKTMYYWSKYEIPIPMYVMWFLEMAEHHDAKTVLSLARNLVLQLQTLIENK